MKAYFIALTTLIFISSCHRKSVPESSESKTIKNAEVKPSAASIGKPLVVVDGKGNLTASTQTLLANGAKTGYSATNARAFTPEQRANLIARFKTVPPRVLHVPDRFSKKTAQGQYYVLKDKFWYWKKTDGFYYLDENYYK